jgi:hypothetical protein
LALPQDLHVGAGQSEEDTEARCCVFEAMNWCR